LDKPIRLRLILFKREGLELKTMEAIDLEEIAGSLMDDDTLGICISKEATQGCSA
jgi:hypothetical protein